MVQNKVEAAYARSDLFERRRILMDDWACYLSGESGSRVQTSGDRAELPVEETVRVLRMDHGNRLKALIGPSALPAKDL